jgi:glucose uptake protein
MILPTTYYATLALVLLGLFCWGSWANTYKLTNGWRFELYYFDFVLGVMITAGLAALTLGTLGFDGFSFMDDILHASKKQDIFGLLAGVVFNLANMLLLAAISLGGLSVAFPVTFAVALAIGVLWKFAANPQGSSLLLFGGALLVLLAAVVIARAYQQYKLMNLDELVRTGQVKSTRKKVSIKAVYISVISGLLLGCFYPLVQKSMEGDTGLGPYSEGFVFALGMILSTFLFNLFFMNLPVSGAPLEILEFFKANIRQHLLGLTGGFIWYVGTLCAFMAAGADGKADMNPAISSGLIQGAAVLSALWGLLLWKEFKKMRSKVRAMLSVGLALYLLGLLMVSVAPLVGK